MIRARVVATLLVLLVLAVGCGSSQSSSSDLAVSGAGAQGEDGGGIDWRSLGCTEPEPLVVQVSNELETDVGLAADSLAARYGLSLEEAKRRLRLQEVLGQRRSEVQDAEAGRVAQVETQHQPYFAAIVTLTGSGAVTERTRELLCETSELEVRVGARFTQDELAAETIRLSQLLGDFGIDVPNFGASGGELAFTVINDDVAERLDKFLAGVTDYPYVINSLEIPPLVLDPTIPFPLIEITEEAVFEIGFSGVLIIDGPCVYLDEVLMILPARETSWNPQTGVLNTGGGDVMSGDKVTGEGSPYEGALSGLAQQPDPSCRADGRVLQARFYPVDPTATPAPFPTAPPVGELDGLRVHPRSTGGGMDAEVGGVLEIGDGCVWLADPSGSRVPVVWPANTFGRTDPAEIVLPSGETVRSGDGISGGGGSVNAARVTEALGLAPFPDGCIQSGNAAVFNSDSPIEVIAGVGVPVVETLVDRFSLVSPIGLELIAVSPNGRSVAVIDFVSGTVHQYPATSYQGPSGAISGASGGGGFTHLWSNGTIYSSYAGITRQPIVYQPDPLIEEPGIASSLRVLPSPDGERTWLIQPGGTTTQIELVNLVEERLTRLSNATIAGTWLPAGATIEGVVLVRQDKTSTVLVSPSGEIVNEQQGAAISVGWQGAAILRPDGSLITTDASLGAAVSVDKITNGEWGSVGGPVIPTDSPPLRTGTDKYLVRLADQLVVVTSSGSASTLHDIGPGQTGASWSRAGDWIVVIQSADLTLVPANGDEPILLGPLVPDDHWVLSAG